MKKGVLFLIFFLIIGIAIQAKAVQITVDLDLLDSSTAAMVVQAEKKAREAAKQAQDIADKAKIPPVNEVAAWANIGQTIGKAIAATCRELSVEVNEFVKTPVGIIAMGLIVYKVIGEKLWDVVGGTLAWIVITVIVFFSFRYFHVAEKILNIDEKTGEKKITFMPKYEFGSDNTKITSVCFHVGIFVLFTVICLIIVF